MFVFWMGIGVAIVSGFIGSRSKGYSVMESFSVAFLYLVTVPFLYRDGFRLFLAITPLKSKYAFVLLFFGFCLIGAVIGKLRKLRREKTQQLT